MRNSLGKFGESWAAAYLQRNGYRILERNVRYRSGEIDLVASDERGLVFVEVKCRNSTQFGAPEASITPSRFARLERTIQNYLAERGVQDSPYRVDVVALEVGPTGRVTRCEVLRGVEAPPPDSRP